MLKAPHLALLAEGVEVALVGALAETALRELSLESGSLLVQLGELQLAGRHSLEGGVAERPGLVRLEARQELSVEAPPARLDQEIAELSSQRGLPLALELKILERLLAATGACDRLTIHDRKIISSAKKDGAASPTGLA